MEKQLIGIWKLRSPDPYDGTDKVEEAEYIQFEFRGDGDKDDGFRVSVDRLYEMLIYNGDPFDVGR